MTLILKDRTEAAELGREMREELKTVGFTLASLASLGVITLHQTGILKHLPQPGVRGFNADKIHGSAQAYQLFSIPDAVLAIGSYAVTLGLAAICGAERAVEHPWIPAAVAAKAGVNALLSATFIADQATKHPAFFLWSLIVVAATFAMLLLIILEACNAIRSATLSPQAPVAVPAFRVGIRLCGRRLQIMR